MKAVLLARRLLGYGVEPHAERACKRTPADMFQRGGL